MKEKDLLWLNGVDHAFEGFKVILYKEETIRHGQ